MEATEFKGSFLYDTLLPKLEVVSWILAVIGFVATWFQLRNANYLLIIGLGSLGYVYMLKAFSPRRIAAGDEQYVSADKSQQYNGEMEPTDAGSNNFDAVRRQLTAFGSGAIFVGVLFRLMAWEYNTNLLLFGEACLLVVILTLALKQHTCRQLVLLAALGGLALYIPAETWIRQFHGSDPVLVQKMIYQMNHPHDRAAAEAVRTYLNEQRHPR